MGLRRMTDRERKATSFMAATQLWSGEDKRSVRGAVARYLMEHGWTTEAAKLRAREAVDAATTPPETPGDPQEKGTR